MITRQINQTGEYFLFLHQDMNGRDRMRGPGANSTDKFHLIINCIDTV